MIRSAASDTYRSRLNQIETTKSQQVFKTKFDNYKNYVNGRLTVNIDATALLKVISSTNVRSFAAL